MPVEVGTVATDRTRLAPGRLADNG
ncbi:protein of unknown function (plasmid) [Streptantibioticus cattleyicolor NRRL 8057 = DSM 46488]|nr:protein of unknown function [Streptantibioticus cattleyicolor NRRL 8057 = DSM 46488]